MLLLLERNLTSVLPKQVRRKSAFLECGRDKDKMRLFIRNGTLFGIVPSGAFANTHGNKYWISATANLVFVLK